MMDRIEVYGAEWCEDTQRTRQQLQSLEVPFNYIDVDRDEAASERVRDWNGGRRITPTVLLPDGPVVTGSNRLAAPSNDELETALRETGVLR